MRGIEIRVQVVCFDAGRLLCARHQKSGREYWVLPGGHLDPGETLWRAAVREIEEESGLALEAGRLWAVGEFLGGERHVVECTFLATAWRGEARTPSGGAGAPAVGADGSLVGLEWLDRSRFERETFLPRSLGRRLLERWDDPDTAAVYLGALS